MVALKEFPIDNDGYEVTGYFKQDHTGIHELNWNIADEEGWPLAHKIYEYIENFGFDVEIVKE